MCKGKNEEGSQKVPWGHVAASFLAFLVNSVQLSEATQLAVTGKGSSPIDDIVPPRFRRLAAALQVPFWVTAAGGELAKVRKAVDGRG